MGIENGKRRRAITARAVAVGLLLVVVICLFASYAEYIAHGYRMGFGHVSMGVLIPFSLVAFGVNPVMRKVRPGAELSREELVVVFLMGLMGSMMPSTKLASLVVGVLAAPHYFQSATNQWGEYILPNIPGWLFPSNETGAITDFFNGLPAGGRIPWEVWIGPLTWWFLFLGAIVVVTMGTFVILRKQWVMNERLVFPLAQVPLEMARGGEGRGPWVMGRSRAFWVGFGIAAGVILWNIVSYFAVGFPRIPTALRGISIRTIPNVPPIHNRIHFLIMGFAFLANTQVLFSVWFFFALALVQIAVLSKLGFNPKGADFYVSGSYMGWQSFGGLAMIVLFALWRSRGHLRDVLKKAWNPGRAEIDDSMEMMSYRGAVLSVALGLGYIVLWLMKSGMDVKSAVLFVGCSGVLYLGLARIVAEAGLLYVRASMSAQSFVPGVVGSSALSAGTMGGIGASYAVIGENYGFVSTASAHIVKLADEIKPPKRSLFAIVFGAGMVGIFVSLVFTLFLAYRMGALNFGRSQFNHINVLLFDQILRKIKEPAGPNWTGIGFFAGGAAFVGILSFLMGRFPWWPLHPIGFTINYVFDIRMFMLSIFIAWLVKYLTLKVGGVAAYRRVAPAFMGMIFGTIFGVIVSTAVDAIWFPGQGHDFWYGF